MALTIPFTQWDPAPTARPYAIDPSAIPAHHNQNEPFLLIFILNLSM
jgi:hypothetical protein